MTTGVEAGNGPDEAKNISIWPAGKDIAECDPVVLRPGATIRLVFHPKLVVNKQDASQPVIGEFVYQRRKKGD